MSNAIGSCRESNPSRRICYLREEPLGHVAENVVNLAHFLMSISWQEPTNTIFEIFSVNRPGMKPQITEF